MSAGLQNRRRGQFLVANGGVKTQQQNKVFLNDVWMSIYIFVLLFYYLWLYLTRFLFFKRRTISDGRDRQPRIQCAVKTHLFCRRSCLLRRQISAAGRTRLSQWYGDHHHLCWPPKLRSQSALCPLRPTEDNRWQWRPSGTMSTTTADDNWRCAAGNAWDILVWK